MMLSPTTYTTAARFTDITTVYLNIMHSTRQEWIA